MNASRSVSEAVADRIEASRLKGRLVRDPDGQVIGTIQDLVVSLGEGRIVEVVVWRNSRPGTEASYRQLPWEAMTPAGDGTAFVADPAAAVGLEMPDEPPGRLLDAGGGDAEPRPG